MNTFCTIKNTYIDLFETLKYFQKAQIELILHLKNRIYLVKKMLKASIVQQNEIMQKIQPLYLPWSGKNSIQVITQYRFLILLKYKEIYYNSFSY